MTVDARPSRKRRLTIDGALVLGNHTDFPLWVEVVDPAGLGAQAQADGSDIYFTTPGGVVPRPRAAALRQRRGPARGVGQAADPDRGGGGGDRPPLRRPGAGARAHADRGVEQRLPRRMAPRRRVAGHPARRHRHA
ncbi:MAG: hypothetical protein HS111_25090 [Kofleriaceae bacterium]|nr:hypothetical protein [Kofleriaceae bacterium]